jgi:UDP-GlcNAc:undecaprenyl-phosphate GlcNAc-1-phosphate transferase
VIIAACLGLVGLWDDRKPHSWSVKLGAQIAAAVALHAAGIRVQLSWLPARVNIALSLFWLIGITNAVNFLDNMNGLSAGLSAIAALAVMALGILNEGWGIAIVAAALAGACLGFLRYNHHWHASIFMGDAGSLFLGCMLASLGLLLRFPCNHNWVTWLCPVLLLAVPVFDMVHVCLARLRRGQNPLSTPGKDHTSHLLVRSGLPRHGAVMVIHAGVALCALAAGIVAYASVFVAYAIAGVIFGSAIYLLLYFELRFGAGGTD